MKKEEDLANLFEAISGIENKYNTSIYKLPKEQKTATVILNAPSEYTMVLTCDQCVNVSALNIEYLQQAMSYLYCTMYGNKINTNAYTQIGIASNNAIKIYFHQYKNERHKSYQCQDKHNINNNHSDNIRNGSNRGSS